MIAGPAHRHKKRARAGSSSNDEARSAAASACSDGFDNVDGGPECRVYIQMRGVEQVRIAARLSAGAAARLVSRSSRRRMSARTSASFTLAAGGPQLGRPAAGAHLAGWR